MSHDSSQFHRPTHPAISPLSLSSPGFPNLSPFPSHCYKLFVVTKNINSFILKHLQTLLSKHRGWGISSTSKIKSCWRSFRPPASSPQPPEETMPAKSKSSSRTNNSARCQHRTAAGRQCRTLANNPSSGLCPYHSVSLDQDNADFLPAVTEQACRFQNAQGINNSLAALFTLVAQGRISPRRASVLAYIGSLLLRSLTAIDNDPYPKAGRPGYIPVVANRVDAAANGDEEEEEEDDDITEDDEERKDVDEEEEEEEEDDDEEEPLQTAADSVSTAAQSVPVAPTSPSAVPPGRQPLPKTAQEFANAALKLEPN
jgi:hypothetical protein